MENGILTGCTILAFPALGTDALVRVDLIHTSPSVLARVGLTVIDICKEIILLIHHFKLCLFGKDNLPSYTFI